MIIEQYGFHLQILFNNNSSINKNISSFDDIQPIRLENIKSLSILSNGKNMISIQELQSHIHNSNNVLDNKSKVLPGWQLRYYIKRQKPDLFKSRGK
jgi:hypothetical protein